MKRKFVSAMLFGALVVAPATTFVGCSDYDDDISGLNVSTTDLKTQLDNQVTALNNLKGDLEAEINKAKADAKQESDNAKAAADNAKAAADRAQNAADQAGKDAAAADQKAAEALQAAAEANAQAALATQAAAQAKLDAINEAKAACQEMINNINAASKDEVNALKTQISAIQNDLSKIDAGQIDSNKQAIEQLKIQLKAVENYKALIDANTAAIGNAATKTELSTQLNDLEKKIDEKLKKLDSTSTTDGLQEDLKGLQKELKEVGDKVNKIEGNLNTLLTSKLKSLVFVPEYYYQGIEAMEAATYNYQTKQLNTVTADGDFGTDAPIYTNSKDINITPDLTASYHLNPSNAEIDTKDMSKYSFLVMNSKYLRASVDKIQPTVYKAIPNKADGTVTVKARFGDADLIKDIATQNQVTVMALQYQVKDTVITSDYAAVRANKYKDLTLNLAKSNKAGVAGEHMHLYKTAKEAINNPAQLEIEWDGTLDIDQYINTHYSLVGGKADMQWDENATKNTVKEKGFEYSYQLVGYHAGSNKTSPTAHLAIKDHTLRAQRTENGEQQPWGYKQGRETIGRCPLVRVVLTDKNNGGGIAAVGYVKLEIVEKVAPPTVARPAGTLTIDDIYTVRCDGDKIEKKYTWYEIEENILNELKISKKEFDTNWEMCEISGGGHKALQYADTNIASGSLSAAEEFGTIEQVVNAGATETTVLKWTITENEAYQLAKQGEKSKTVYIRFKNKNNSNELATIKFVYEPKEQNINLEGKITDSKKISNYWYKKNQKGAGFDEIHGNVQVVGQTNANDEFTFNVSNTFIGNKITGNDLNLDAKYEKIKQNASVNFVFVKPEINTNVPGLSGAKYSLSVSDDGSTLKATKDGSYFENIAKITSAGVVTYLKTDFAKDLLNNADHSLLGDRQSLTARVAIIAKTCDPAGDIKLLSGNEFNVKFLRPVTIKSGGPMNFEDGVSGGSVAKVELKFIDWRDHDFNNKSQTGNYNYYTYYGVSKIEIDKAHITTDMSGHDINKDFLDDIDPNRNKKLKYVAPASTAAGLQEALKNGDFGKLILESSGNTLTAFKLRIPVIVTYDWGKVTTKIEVTVGKTISNARPRR